VFELAFKEFSGVQRNVLSEYCRAFARRRVFIKPVSNPGAGRYLFTGGSPPVNKESNCYWNWHSNSGIDVEAGNCSWIWHHGPKRELVVGDHPRVVILPRNDLFCIRGLANTPEVWAQYRATIGTGWSEKRNKVYFRGHFTGERSLKNARAVACQLIEGAGFPANVGLLAESTPPELIHQVPIRESEPLQAMGQYRYVLSLQGNHPFNARLYRGLEAGSLVFHQATPSIRLLEDGVLEPGRHYVEIAADLFDLLEKVDYFMGHPADAHEIAEAGHQAWMENFFTSTPFAMSNGVWELFTSQPRWGEFRETFGMQ
jgi:hypothetical protein